MEEPWQLWSDSWSSGHFSTEQVFYADVRRVSEMVELDPASSQGTVKTSGMSTITVSTHWGLKPCFDF